MGYRFMIEYKMGIANRTADALSRGDEEEIVLLAISLPTWLDWDALNKDILENEGIQTIISDVKSHLGKHAHCSIVNDKLCYNGRLVILSPSSWTQRLMSEMNCTFTGGHSGAYCTYCRITAELLLFFFV